MNSSFPNLNLEVCFENSIISIHMELIDYLSHIKFDDKGKSSILWHTILFINFHEINYGEVSFTLFIVAPDGQVRK